MRSEPDDDGPAEPRLVLGLANYSPTDRTDWTELLDVAVAAEEAGFDRIVVSDHVAFGPDMADYARPERGGTAGGRQPTGPDGSWLEPLTVLTWLAARTTTIRLGTNIVQAALRRPVVLAKVAATLDVLSGGRLDLGVGVGWQSAEYEAAGLDFSARGRLLDESLEICSALWTGEPVDHESPHASLRAVQSRPAPVQAGGPPVWVSGTLNPNVVRRLARFASGWVPWGPDAADLRPAVARMRRLVAAAGGSPPARVFRYVPLRASSSRGSVDPWLTFADVAADVAAGITDFRVPLAQPDTSLAIADRLAEMVEAFRERVD